MLSRLFSRKNIVIIILLATAVAGFFVVNYFFPFISADTDPTTGVELIKKGNFEVVPTFDESVWEKTTNNLPTIGASIVDKRLVLEEKSATADFYITIDQKFPIKKGKLYKTQVNFETDFSDKLTIIAGIRIPGASAGSYTNLQNQRFTAVENNKPTTFTAYFSPLKDQDNSQFFLTVKDGIGKIKIKKISVVECDHSEIGGVFPDIISRYLSGITLIESYFKAVPWRLGEPNSTDGASSGPIATSSEKAIIFSADVDSLASDAKPKSDQVISELKSSLARGEIGNSYLSIYAKSELLNLKVVVSDLTASTSPSTLKPNLLSVRYREKQDNDKSWGTYSYKNEIIEPFSELKKLKTGNNQSFMIDASTTMATIPGEYRGEISITADGYSKKLPIVITINKFPLENLQAQRTLMIQEDDRWQLAWNKDQVVAKKQIESEVKSALSHGFNSFEFSEHIPNIVDKPGSPGSMIVQFGRKYPRQIKFDPTNLVSGFNLSDSNKYAISIANQVASEKNLYAGNNVFSMQTVLYYIMHLNGKFGSAESSPISSGDHAGIWEELKTESIDGPIANQLVKVMNDIRDQNNLLGEPYKDKIQFYFVDEAGASTGELDVGLWMDKVAKKAGFKTYFTGSNDQASATIGKMTADNMVSTYSLGAGDQIPDPELVPPLQAKNIRPSLYTGVYLYQDGNRLRNRYLSGFFGNRIGISDLLAWKYLLYYGYGAKDATKRFNDFDRNQLTWDSAGREWNLEYFDDQSYRESYRNYYGVDIVKTDQSQNIPSLQYFGFFEADKDLRYLAMAKKVVGASALPSKAVDLAEIGRIASDLPASNRTIYGENVSNKILDAKRTRLSELIAKHYIYVNQPPVLSPIGNKEIVAGQKLTFDLSATDPDGDTISYSATGLPSGATLVGQKFSWTPASSQSGSYKITFKASDGKLVDSEEITIVVKSVAPPPAENHPPIMTPVGNKEVEEMHILDFSILASDPDGDTLTYSAENLPAGATFNTATRRFAWIPDYSQAGVYSGVHFSVTDGEFTVYDDITITVKNINRSPVLSSIGNKEIVVDNNLAFNIYGSDFDGGTLNFSAIGLPAGAIFSGQSFSWTPLTSQVGSYIVTFKVSDGELTDSEEISIEVKTVVSPPPPPPPPPTYKTADINHDGKVDLLDLSIIASHWGAIGAGQPGGDINNDGIVDLLDLSIVASQWEG